MFGYSFELAFHGLKRAPKTTILAVLTVAIGLSASMTTLALLHMLSADPLPGRSQHLYLAWLDTVQAKSQNNDLIDDVKSVYYARMKTPDVQALMAARTSLRQAAVADVYLHMDASRGRSIDDQHALLTTANFISMFGVPLREGRGWTADEDAAHAPVAVIEGDLAQKLFGTTHAIGRTLDVKGHAFEIIGISAPYAPQPHFYGLQAWTFSGSDRETVFLPYVSAIDAGVSSPDSDGCDEVTDKDKSMFDVDPKHCAWLNDWVELDTPQQVADFRNYLDTYAHQQASSLASYGKKPQSRLLSVQQWLTLRDVIPDSVRLNVLLASSFLLLCMVNVAGLLAAKFMRRSSEVGIRRAMGASRRAVMVQHLAEASAVCMLGGLLAWPLTLLGLYLLRMQDQGFTDLAHLDVAMFGALFVLALLVGVLVGLLPSWRVSLVQPGLQIKSA